MNTWLEKLAINKNLRGEDFRVLFLLMSQITDGSTEIYLTQAQIAKRLDIQASNICRSITRLTKEKIIVKNLINNKIVGYKLLI